MDSAENAKERGPAMAVQPKETEELAVKAKGLAVMETGVIVGIC